jgi:hypothetical protein
MITYTRGKYGVVIHRRRSKNDTSKESDNS